MERGRSGPSSEQRLQARAPRRDKPDPRPARLMLGAGALAALTVVPAELCGVADLVGTLELPYLSLGCGRYLDAIRRHRVPGLR